MLEATCLIPLRFESASQPHDDDYGHPSDAPRACQFSTRITRPGVMASIALNVDGIKGTWYGQAILAA
jgi:hypothetical protein